MPHLLFDEKDTKMKKSLVVVPKKGLFSVHTQNPRDCEFSQSWCFAMVQPSCRTVEYCVLQQSPLKDKATLPMSFVTAPQ